MPIDAEQYFSALARQYNSPKEATVDAAKEQKLRNFEARKAQMDNALGTGTSSLISGAGATLSGLGTVGGLISGNMDNQAVQLGDRISAYGDYAKPEPLRRAEGDRLRAIEGADTQWGKFKAAVGQTITDPTLMGSLVASQAPNLIPGMAAGRIASAAGASARLAGNVGIGAGNALHSADSAGETYETLMTRTSQADWDANPEYQNALANGVNPQEAKHSIALGQSRQSAGIAGATSLATNFIPGANIAERYLATPGRAATGIAKGLALGAFGEGTQEIIEEGSGKLAGNYSIGQIDSTRSLEEGLGEASALGLLGGAAMGAGFGGLSGITASSPEEKAKRAETRAGRLAKRQEARETKAEKKATREAQKEQPAGSFSAQKASEDLINDTIPINERVATAAQFENHLKEVEELKAKLETEGGTETDKYKEASDYLEKVAERYKQAKEVLDEDIEFEAFEQEQQAKDVETAKGNDKNATPEDVSKATDSVIDKYMKDPSSMSEQDVDAILGNKNLTEDQRNIMFAFREDSAARNASRDASQVSESIQNGVEGFKGLDEYDTDIGIAVNKGDTAKVKTEIDSANKFKEYHDSKLKAVNEAMDASIAAKASPDKKISNRPARYVYQDPEVADNNGWIATDTAPWNNEKERNRMGGLVVREESSTDLLATMEADNQAISAAVNKYQVLANYTPTVQTPNTVEPVTTPPVEDNAGPATPTPLVKVEPIDEKISQRFTRNQRYDSFKGLEPKQLKAINDMSTEKLEALLPSWKEKATSKANLAINKQYAAVVDQVEAVLASRVKPVETPSPTPKKTSTADEQAGQLSLPQDGDPSIIADIEKRQDEARERNELEKSQLNYMVTRFLVSEQEGNMALSGVDGDENRTRSKSLNPDWFQNNKDMSGSGVGYVRKAVTKYIKNQKLGKKETRVIEALKLQLAYEKQGGESSESNFDPNPAPVSTDSETIPAADSNTEAQPEVVEEAETTTPLSNDGTVNKETRLTEKDLEAVMEAADKEQEKRQNSYGAGKEAQYAFTQEYKSGKSIKEAMDAIEDEYNKDFFSYEGHENGWSSLAEALTSLGYITEEEMYSEDKATSNDPEAGMNEDGTPESDNEAGLEEFLANQEQQPSEDEEFYGFGEDVGESLTAPVDEEYDAAVERDTISAEELTAEQQEAARNQAEYDAEAWDFFANNEPPVDTDTFDPNNFVDGFNSGVVNQVDPDQAVQGQLQTKDDYRKVNKITAYFTQKFNNPHAVTPLPLVTTENFFSTLAKRSRVREGNTDTIVTNLQKSVVNKFYKPKKSLTNEEAGKQKILLQTLSAFVKHYGPLIQANHKSPAADSRDSTVKKSRSNNYVQYLENPGRTGGKENRVDLSLDGVLPENVVHAIAVAMFNYISTNGGDNNKLNYDKDIRYITGRSKNDPVSQADREVLQEVGQRKINIVQELGKDIYQMLGFAPNSKDVPINEKEQLIIALGSEALSMMLQVTPSPNSTPDNPKLALPLLDETNVPSIYITSFPLDDNNLRKDLMETYDIPEDKVDSVLAMSEKEQMRYIRDLGFQPLYQPFIRINRSVMNSSGKAEFDIDGVPSPIVSFAAEKSKGISSFIPEMFGMKPKKTLMSESPKSFVASKTNKDGTVVNAKIRKTGSGVPTKLGKALEVHGARPLYSRQDKIKLRNQMGKKAAQEVIGIKEKKYGHKSLVMRNRSIREKKLADWDAMEEFESSNGTKPAYLTPDPWANQRAGNAQNTVDPVDSTLHRHNMYYKAWESTFDITPNQDSGMETRFKLAVGQALGFDVDKMVDERNIGDINEAFQEGNPAQGIPEGEYVPAIKVLQKSLKEKVSYRLTDEENQIILDAVAISGEEDAALDGLLQYAAYQNAAANTASNPNERQTRNSQKKAQFKAKIFFEIDGLSNGVALSQIMLGVPGQDAASFGFFNAIDAEQYSGFAQWKTETNGQDPYEGVLNNAQSMISPDQQVLADALMTILTSGKGIYTESPASEEGEAVTNDFRNSGINSKGRKLVKTPIVMINYGGGVEGSVASIGRGLVESWYEQLEDALNENGMDGVEQQLNRMNAVLPAKGQINITLINTPEAAMDFSLSPLQEQMIANNWNETYGAALQDAIEQKYEQFIDRQKTLAHATLLDYSLYQNAYNVLEQREQNKIPKLKSFTPPGKDKDTKKKYPRQEIAAQDLTQNQQDAIHAELAALGFRRGIHTAFSQPEGASSPNTVPLAKNNLQTVLEYEKAYEQAPTFNDVYKEEFSNNISGQNINGSMKVRGQKRQVEEPGVRGLAIAIQSTDSAISHEALLENSALQIHDAHGVGIKDMYTAANNLNRATWNNLLNYSVPQAMNETLQTNFTAYAKFAEKYSEADNQPTYVDFFGNTKPITSTMVNDTNVQTLQMTYEKLLFLKNEVALVDQYSLEGGAYVVTEQDLENVQTAIDAVEKELADLVRARNKQTALADAVAADQPTNNKKSNKPAKATLNANNIKGPTAKSVVGSQVTPEQRPWGEENLDSQQDNNEFLESTIQKTPRLNVRSLGAAIKGALSRESLKGNQTKFNVFQEQLLNKIMSLDLDIDVVYVTKNTQLPKDVNPNDAWFGRYRQTEDGKQTLYIKSSEFDSSSVTPVTLIHELLHGATSILVAKYSEMKQKDVPKDELTAWQAVQELEKLRQASIEYINKNHPDNKAFAYGVSDIDEFIAVGMTDIAFQSQVLMNVQFDGTVTGALIKNSGWSGFVKNITNLFYTFSGIKRNTETATRDGMATLMALTALTMEQQQAQRSASTQANNSKPIDKLMADTNKSPLSYTTEQIFNALVNGLPNPASLSKDWRDHLESTLETLVGSAFGNNGVIRAESLTSAPVQADDVFLKALVNGDLPFASSLLNTMALNSVEAYTAQSVEIVVQAAFNAKTSKTSQVRRQLRQAYDQAVRDLSVDDLIAGDRANATQEEIAAAESVYKLIFEPSKGETDSEYLSRFAAATQAYKPLYDALQNLQSDGQENFTNATVQRKIVLILSKIADWLSSAVSGVKQGANVGESVRNAALEAASKMAQVEARKQQTVGSQKLSYRNISNVIDQKTLDFQKIFMDKLSALSQTPALQYSKSGVIRFAAKVGDKIGTDKTDDIFKGLSALRNHIWKGRNGVMGSIVNEMRNGSPEFDAVNKLKDAGNQLEQLRVRTKAEVSSMTLDSFESLTDTESEAMTKSLKLDLASLLSTHTVAEIEQLVSDPAKRAAEISRLEAKLESISNKETFSFWITKSKDLGYFLATKDVTRSGLLLNANAILNEAGTLNVSNAARTPETLQDIDQLISLYGMQETDPAMLNRISSVARNENNRSDDGNGFAFILKYHDQLKKDALENEFDVNPYSMEKGHIDSITDPNVSFKLATLEEGKSLEKAGYKQLGTTPVGSDPMALAIAKATNQPIPEKTYLYTIIDGGITETVSGAAVIGDKRSMGQSQFPSMYNRLTGKVNLKSKDFIRAVNQAERMLNAKQPPVVDPRAYSPVRGKGKERYMVPVLDSTGQFSNYRYVMSESTEKQLLDPNNRVNDILGKMTSVALDKKTRVEQNKNVIDTVFDIFAANKNNEDFGEQFIVFGPNSTDPIIRERYALMPEEAKQYMQYRFGKREMKVNVNQYDILFGYRKYSLGQVFEKEMNDRNVLEQALVNTAVAMFGDKAKFYVQKGERGIQAMMRMVKDFLVIKRFATFVGNEISNDSILALAGMSLPDIVRDKALALDATVQYVDDRKLRDALERQVAMGLDKIQITAGKRKGTFISQKAASALITKLDSDIEANIVAPLMDAGQFSTMVEDLEQEPDRYGYRSRMEQKIDNALGAKVDNPLIKGARSAGGLILMSHDTTLYKLMSKATIMSDFTSRYALYKHEMEKDIDPKSKDEALKYARHAFVNYDVPTHKSIQYLNDMGLLLFTKYYLRIQFVFLKMLRENPGRAALLAATGGPLGLPTIMDSSVLSGNNPVRLNDSILGLPSAISQAAPLAFIGGAL